MVKDLIDDAMLLVGRQSRDRMTWQQSRDVEQLRDWLEDERRMRRDMMTSQELLQTALVECLRTANQQLSAVMVRLMSGPAGPSNFPDIPSIKIPVFLVY